VDVPAELIANPDVVLLDVRAASRAAALRALHTPLAAVPGVNDGARFLRDLQERARVASVCIAADLALPHARTAAVDRIVLGIGRMAEPGVAFDDEHPQVRLVFMIGTPKPQVEGYLKLVSAISRLLRHDGVRAALLAAATEAEFRALLGRGAGP
jgi:mannitol/fructose-specific phosphotransferase system IIA component (Ntr-type)